MPQGTAELRKPERPQYVFDSFAWLAWFADEPGAAMVQTLLEKAQKDEVNIHVSWMNVSEVYYITARRSLDSDRHMAAKRAVEIIENLPVQIHTVSKNEALAAARFKADHALSLADAFAAALAQAHGAQIVTGDPEFQSLEKKPAVRILWIAR